MHLWRELRRREGRGEVIRVAVVGAGAMGRGIAAQVAATPGMRLVAMANRTPARAVAFLRRRGVGACDVVRSDDPHRLAGAIADGGVGVTRDPLVATALPAVDVVVEATGTVVPAMHTVLSAFAHGKHVVAMNAELDATLGAVLHARARRWGVVYGFADGDQPGVMMRLVEWCANTGFDVVAAVNCKGFLDVHATPDSVRGWAERMATGAHAVCSFTDGTKMQLENAIVANAARMPPAVRGMRGIRTTLTTVLADFASLGDGGPVVEYTLGGDFGGGVFVIARCDDRERVGRYLDYLKMGGGPHYLFYRPYHLCHVETPVSIAEAVLYGEPTIASAGPPVVDVVTIAKRDLAPGDRLDGIGGYACRGELDTVAGAAGLLPIGLAAGVRLRRRVARDRPIAWDDVEIDANDPLVRLRAEQDALADLTPAAGALPSPPASSASPS